MDGRRNPGIDRDMIGKSVLDRAKAFLCWDVFSQLSVQLAEVQEAVSYFYPPSDRKSIVVFYETGNPDFSVPLFHLFHEAGHLMQWEEYRESGKTDAYWEYVDMPTGPAKVAFETESWDKGRELITRFIQSQHLDHTLLNRYNACAKESIETYA